MLLCPKQKLQRETFLYNPLHKRNYIQPESWMDRLIVVITKDIFYQRKTPAGANKGIERESVFGFLCY